jgi:hypothetical protein
MMVPSKSKPGEEDSTERTPRHTADTIATIIRQNIEPDTAEEVLVALKQLDGQLITSRLLDKLPGGRVEWRLHRQLGELEIRNRAYIHEKREGVRLTLAQNNANTVSADFIEEKNPHYFKDQRARNHMRAKALADHALLERVAVLFNEIEAINTKRALAHKQFAVIVHSEPLFPDRHDLARACGLHEDDKQK